MDPKTMQDDSVEMMKRGFPPDAIVKNLVKRGANEEAARALVVRLAELKREAEAAALASPAALACGACGAPMDVAASFYDAQGRQICTSCNVKEQVRASHQRAEESRLEAQGAPMGSINLNAASQPTRRCAKCRTPTARHVHTTHHYVRGRGSRGKTYKYQCVTCGSFFTLDSLGRFLSTAVGACFVGGCAWAFILSAVFQGKAGEWHDNLLSTGILVILALSPIYAVMEIADRVRHPVG